MTAFHWREWLPAAISILAILLTASYAVTKRSSAADRIAEVNELATTLAQTAVQARVTTLSPQESRDLFEQKADLENRMIESRKPGLVVAELSESARAAGLSVHEIQPAQIPGRRGRPGEQETIEYPRYRVSVSGEYRQVAEYMQMCTRQRLPARVVQCQITPVENEGKRRGDMLSAEITFEAFQPESPASANQGKP